MEFPEDSPRAREDREAEAWLRRELEFLHGVERRILRRSRVRDEAWRAAAVGFILAMFACCWYLAALGSSGSGGSACPSVGTGAAVPVARPGTGAGSHGAVAAAASYRTGDAAQAAAHADASNPAKTAEASPACSA